MRRALPILFSASLLLGCDGTSPTDDDSTVASDNDTADDDAPDDDASITDNDTADDDSGDDDSTPCSDRCILGASPFDGGLVRGCALGPDLCPTWTPGLDCGSLGALCVEDGPLASCVPMGGATCWDAVANQGESDIDCGGPCAPCPLDAACQLDDDCSTGLCDPASLTCASPPGETCSDGMTNQGESDADCGGPCAPCGPDATCAIDDDCSTGLCDPLTFTCESPTVETCWDGLSNQDESGIDCGGALCAACGLGELCFASTDCQSGNCDLWDTETCVPGSQATCADAAQNDDESDVDCGGATCEPCDLGAACASDLDCASLNCDVGTTDLCVDAAAPTCSDGLWNQDEEDIDCGGSTCTSCTPPSYLLDEDWEDGDFSRFAWQLGSSPAGTFPWEIETVAANCEQGLFCVRTAPTHPAGEVAWFELSLSVREDSDLSFRARVNTEPGEHVLSVWVDGSFVQEWSGVQPWQTLTLPVPATGPGGPDRVLRFEYSRSSFVDPMHPPYNQVWIDVIDLPGWNSTPETPTLQSPWIDSVITDPTPLLQWMTDDPDGDTIIHQVQVSDDPLFTNPFDSGEIGAASWASSAPLADRLSFRRARAKDGIDHRYSPWSETWTFSLDSAALPGSLWLQDQESQFAANTLVDTATDGDSVVPSEVLYDSGWTPVSATGPGQIEQWTLTGLPYVVPGSSGIVSVRTTGDFDALSEYCTASIDGLTLGNHNPQSASLAATDFFVADITPYVVDGTATLTCSSNPGIASGTVEMRLQYTTSIDGTVMGPPVDFAWAFPGRGHWEKARWSATGDMVVHVYDGAGALLPDAVLPGNSAGFTSGTVHLWDVDTAAYPVLRLGADLGLASRLSQWSLHAGEEYLFDFEQDGDLEGWVGADGGVVPTTDTVGGVLRFDSAAAGTNPRVEYWFPTPIDATRFVEVECVVRSSNTWSTDSVGFYWANNYGGFDAVRHLEQSQYLGPFVTVTFDLLAAAVPPQQPFQGWIDAIRFDPVVDFYDAVGAPTDGWFEIESITLR